MELLKDASDLTPTRQRSFSLLSAPDASLLDDSVFEPDDAVLSAPARKKHSLASLPGEAYLNESKTKAFNRRRHSVASLSSAAQRDESGAQDSSAQDSSFFRRSFASPKAKVIPDETSFKIPSLKSFSSYSKA